MAFTAQLSLFDSQRFQIIPYPQQLLLHTQLVLSSSKQYLLTHPDQDLASYFLDIVPNIVRNTLHLLHLTSNNMLPARENPKVIEKYL